MKLITSTIFSILVIGIAAYMPPTNPTWPPTYNMTLSSITMQCNGSGFSSPTAASHFGIISYDWSNTKSLWAKAQPMNSEQNLLIQAEKTRKDAIDSKIFVYRNLVWAMPWMEHVREKLDDPAYSGFFLNFDRDKYEEWEKLHPNGGNNNSDTTPFHVNPCAIEDPKKCSKYYHDQNQSPAVPTTSHPHVDGACDPKHGCNCGTMPCGGYVWDHRNGTMLREFLIKEYIGGTTGLGSNAIDGFFIDDFWCSDKICNETNNSVAACPCNDPAQGPTEIVRTSVEDMGLSDSDVKELTLAWNETMSAVEKYILDNNGYTWSLMYNQNNANAAPSRISNNSCASALRSACSKDSTFFKYGNLFGITTPHQVKNGTFIYPQLEIDIAFFLLARGPYAWVGYGVWGMTWPFNPEPRHGELPPQKYGLPRPHLMDHDFGSPVDPSSTCVETDVPGIFQRKWTKAGVVELNCNTYTASFEKL